MSIRPPEPKLKLGEGTEVNDAIAYLIEIRGLANKKDTESGTRVTNLRDFIYRNIREGGTIPNLFLSILQSENLNSRAAIMELINHRGFYKFNLFQPTDSKTAKKQAAMGDYPLTSCLKAAIMRGEERGGEEILMGEKPDYRGLWRLTAEAYDLSEKSGEAFDAFNAQVILAWDITRVKQSKWGKRCEQLIGEFQNLKTEKPGEVIYQLNRLEEYFLKGITESAQLQKLATSNKEIHEELISTLRKEYYTAIAKSLEARAADKKLQEEARDIYYLVSYFANMKAENLGESGVIFRNQLSKSAQLAINTMNRQQIPDFLLSGLLAIATENGYKNSELSSASRDISVEYKERKEADAQKRNPPFWRKLGFGGKSALRTVQIDLYKCVNSYLKQGIERDMTPQYQYLCELGCLSYLAWQLAQEKRGFTVSDLEPIILEKRRELFALAQSNGWPTEKQEAAACQRFNEKIVRSTQFKSYLEKEFTKLTDQQSSGKLRAEKAEKGMAAWMKAFNDKKSKTLSKTPFSIADDPGIWQEIYTKAWSTLEERNPSFKKEEIKPKK